MQGLYLDDDGSSKDLAWMPDWLLKICKWIFVDAVAQSSAALYAASTWHFRRRAIREQFVPDEQTESHSLAEWLLIGPLIAVLWLLGAKDAVHRLRRR